MHERMKEVRQSDLKHQYTDTVISSDRTGGQEGINACIRMHLSDIYMCSVLMHGLTD